MRKLLTGLFLILVCFSVIARADQTEKLPAIPGAPKEIADLFQKVANGKTLTEAEQKKISDWLAKQGAAAGDDSPSLRSGGGGGDPCRRGGHAIAITAPTADAYKTMAADAAKTYAARVPHGAAEKLRGVLAGAQSPTYGGDLALMLIAGGSGSAGVYSAAFAAQKAPDDAITANNLGVALRGMKDYKRAAIAFGRARALAPHSAIVDTNLGWLAMSQKDPDAAKGFFKSAVAVDSSASSALAGLGLIEQCNHHYALALPLFRASLKNGFSDLAAAGVNSAEDGLQAEAEKSGKPADFGSPDEYGSKGGSVPDWPEPPLPVDARTMAAYMAVEPSLPVRFSNYWGERAKATSQQDMQVGLSAKGRSNSGSGAHREFTRGYDKEDFVLSDIRRMIGAKMGPPIDRLGHEFEQFQQSDGCLACGGGDSGDVKCSVTRPRVTALYGPFRASALADWNDLRKAYGDLYGFSQPWIAQIHDPATRALEVNANEQNVIASATAYAMIIVNAGLETKMAWDAPGDCDEVHAAPHPAEKPLKKYKVDPEECKSGETHMNFGVANFNADCDHMTLDFGEGVLFSGDYKFGKDWSDDQITIFGGAGVSGGLGPLSATAKTGAFITLQGGNVVDYGNQSTAGVSVGYGPGSASVEAGVRISAVSGLDTSLDRGVTIGAPGAE